MKAYTLKIRGGCERDSMGKKAGKGALIQEDLSATLGVSQDQTLFQPVTIATIEGNGTRKSHRGSGISEGGVAYTLNSVERHAVAFAIENHPQDGRTRITDPNTNQPLSSNMCHDAANGGVIMIENHPNDSRVRIDDSGKVQTLTSRCGTGGGNVPIVMFSKVKRAQSNEDYETWGDTGVSNTLNNFDNGDVRTNECVVCKVLNPEDSQGNHVTDSRGIYPTLRGCGGGGYQQGYVLCEGNKHGCEALDGYNLCSTGDKTMTITAGRVDDHHIPTVAYCIGNGQVHDAQRPDKELAKTLNCMDDPMKVMVAKNWDESKP